MAGLIEFKPWIVFQICVLYTYLEYYSSQQGDNMHLLARARVLGIAGYAPNKRWLLGALLGRLGLLGA